MENKENITEKTEEDNQRVDSSKIEDEDSTVNLQEEVLKLKEEKTYLLATLENERKLHFRDSEQLAKHSNRKLLLKILPTVDDYERALKFADSLDEPKMRRFVSGFEITLKNLKQSLRSEGIEEYNPTPFVEIWDSHYCEVVDEIENDQYEKGTVLEVAQRGYLLHQRVLVTAKVVISKKSLSN